MKLLNGNSHRVGALFLCLAVAQVLSWPMHFFRGSRIGKVSSGIFLLMIGYGRNIQPIHCEAMNQGGICMFAWDCMKANGTHLGTCIDRFYFGSCCKLNPGIPNTQENEIDSENESMASIVFPEDSYSTIPEISNIEPINTGYMGNDQMQHDYDDSDMITTGSQSDETELGPGQESINEDNIGLVGSPDLEVTQSVESKPVVINEADLEGGVEFGLVPIESGPEQPIESGPEQPIESGPEQPIESGPEQPIESGPEQPIESGPEQPIESGPEQPIESGPEQPIESSPEQPIESGPEQPIASGPEQPIASGPEQPIESGPEQPIESGPEQPIESGPEQPIESGPEQPIESGPEQPIESGPEQPIESGPEQPIESGPEQPIESGPEQPIESGPEQPIESGPEQPIESGPEQPIESGPEQPIESGHQDPAEGPEVVETVPEVVETVPEVVETVPEVVETVPEVVEPVPGVVETVPEVVETVPEVEETVPEVEETVPAKSETETVESATETVESATETAESATETAESATETAESATNTAETPAETAETPAETAETPAETAETPAETAETPAETAETPAETAETPAETAETPAETPAETAETATETAETATETAETATETAETATETAETATETAETATETAETATETAETATETAETATETAETATETVETATETVETATEIAETATEIAETSTEASSQGVFVDTIVHVAPSNGNEDVTLMSATESSVKDSTHEMGIDETIPNLTDNELDISTIQSTTVTDKEEEEQVYETSKPLEITPGIQVLTEIEKTTDKVPEQVGTTQVPQVTTDEPIEKITEEPEFIETTKAPANESMVTIVFPEDSASTVAPPESVTESDVSISEMDFLAQEQLVVEALKIANYKDICGSSLYPTSRIVGGSEASYGQWPWQVSLRQWRSVAFLHKCGAALVNENWAITAAHCVEGIEPDQLLLVMGEFDLGTTDEPYPHVERSVQVIAMHPKFEPRTFEYDLALLRFSEPLVFQPNIIPICIPDDDYNFMNETGFVTGWGRLYEDGPLPTVMQKVPVPVIPNEQCEEMYKTAGYIEHIPKIFICAGYQPGKQDSCEGDSGGPLVIKRDGRWRLAGVISWGIGCAVPNQPGVYTRISEFRDWINKIIVF